LILDLEEQEVGRAEGPPALVVPSDPRGAAEAIETTVARAAGESGISLPAGALWAGLAGAGRPGEREAVEIALRSMGLARRVKVGMDVEGAHRDAFGYGPGVLLVVGTGSMAWGQDPEGREVRVGGWGTLLGDEGSGYWFGLQALKAVVRAADGRGPITTLTDTILKGLHLRSPHALIPWTASATKGEIASLSPLLLEAGVAGDPAAAEILEEGLEALLGHLQVVRSRWPHAGGAIPMALVGGVVDASAPFRRRLEALVEGVGGRLTPHAVIPVRGAAQMAMALAIAPSP